MSLKLYNTLNRRVEEFKPLNRPRVSMYVCGPTVYDYMHIGNLRTFVVFDVLHRVLLSDGFEVKFVQNITDIDDKIIKKSQAKNEPIAALVEEYTKYFFEDLKKLNILPANTYPKATEHIKEMVKFIEELLKKGLAYVEDDGSVYFDISKFPGYGRLSRLDKRELKTGTRILSDDYTKENIQDFALWKGVGQGEFGYDSPWGRGRPGWHIECSVMSQQYLGETFDIHGGGVDLIFPHHENEIAQSEGKTGQPLARLFVHSEHLLIDGQKMSKSLGNFYTLRDIKQKGFEPLALRYLYLTAHYRDMLNFTWESLRSAQNALDKLRETIRAWDEPKIGCAEFEQQFKDAVNNDLNTPQALAVMWSLLKSDYPASAKAKSLLEMDKVLGLKLEEYVAKPLEIPIAVQKLIEQREKARSRMDFEKSDALRKEIVKLGFEIEDTPEGPKVKSAKG